MGWNQVHQTTSTPLMKGIVQDTNFYFVHSYYAIPTVKDHIIATTDYGSPFVSAVQRDNVFATQFHPEKSGDAGLRLYANFVRFSGQRPSPAFT
jgi:glutamine amidotransferase